MEDMRRKISKDCGAVRLLKQKVEQLRREQAAKDAAMRRHLELERIGQRLVSVAVDALIAKLESVEAERDAIRAELEELKPCEACRWNDEHAEECPELDCKECQMECHCKTCIDGENWEWRGIQEKGEGE